MCSKTYSKVIYWLTLIGPFVDIIKGTVSGLYNAYKSVKAERLAQEAEEKWKQQQEAFKNDNL